MPSCLPETTSAAPFFISHAPSGRSTHAVTPGVASASVRLPRAAETTEEPAARGGQERGA